MTLRAIDVLLELRDVGVHAGLQPSVLRALELSQGLALPPEHQNLLCSSNGVEAYAGYFRIFGLGPGSLRDSLLWNEHEYWKFAWRDRCSAYWCFGETAWGDQYAYRIDSLTRGATPAVYFLDALSMTAEKISSSFAEFLEKEYLRLARDPYDHMVLLARAKLGPLSMGSLLVFVPSLLLGGTENVDNIQTLDARVAMVCNGDIACQLEDAPVDAALRRLEPYEDEKGRMRLRLVWAPVNQPEHLGPNDVA